MCSGMSQCKIECNSNRITTPCALEQVILNQTDRDLVAELVDEFWSYVPVHVRC